MSKFQIALLVVFGAFIVIAVILFSRNKGSSSQKITVSVWGTMSLYDFNNVVGKGLGNNDLKFAYTEKSVASFQSDFTEALAEGKGPDLVIISLEDLLKDKSKLIVIPPSSVSPGDFSKTFVKEGELFETAAGAYALPMYVDPMVLYWNRDKLSASAFALPPVYWDQIYDYINKLTTKDGAGNITNSALALGEVKNIPNGKEILSLLMFQAGTPVVETVGSGLRSALLESFGHPESPAASALSFYTQFANPQKSFYSWNRSLLPADTSFAAGKSALYLGFASELPILKAKNPTLDIGIAAVPQSRASGTAITYGRIYGVAISRSTTSTANALAGALALVGSSVGSALSEQTTLVPARRDLLSVKQTDPAKFIFYSSALQAKGWLDPDASKTDTIFANMIESVTSGRARIDEALRTADSALNTLLSKSQ